MTDVDIVIRAGNSDDADTIAAVGAQSFRAAYGPHATPADLESHVCSHFTATIVRAEIEQQNRDYLLALRGNTAGGIAKYRQAPCPVPGGEANAVELQQLYVMASMQGHGLGQHLLGRLVDITRHAGARGIWLSAWEFADWAIRFYARSGFVAIGKVDFKLGQMTHSDLLLWKPLD